MRERMKAAGLLSEWAKAGSSKGAKQAGVHAVEKAVERLRAQADGRGREMVRVAKSVYAITDWPPRRGEISRRVKEAGKKHAMSERTVYRYLRLVCGAIQGELGNIAENRGGSAVGRGAAGQKKNS